VAVDLTSARCVPDRDRCAGLAGELAMGPLGCGPGTFDLNRLEEPVSSAEALFERHPSWRSLFTCGLVPARPVELGEPVAKTLLQGERCVKVAGRSAHSIEEGAGWLRRT
jgi:hypothetical protein